jgi:hypothetical protein
MLKPLFLALTVCLGISGCTTSQTWEKVTRTRPDSNDGSPESSAAYATKLHRVLKDSSVDHKVVAYQYHYTTGFFGEDIDESHTAVIYKDDTNPNNPWWLMEEQLAKPVWVPGDHPESQVAFFTHHQVQVVNEKDFPGGRGDGKDTKASVALGRSGSGHGSHGSQYARASHSIHFRTGPSENFHEMSAGVAQSAPQRLSYTELFRSVHGRAYNPASAEDRREMEALQRQALKHRHPLALQTY